MNIIILLQRAAIANLNCITETQCLSNAYLSYNSCDTTHTHHSPKLCVCCCWDCITQSRISLHQCSFTQIRTSIKNKFKDEAGIPAEVVCHHFWKCPCPTIGKYYFLLTQGLTWVGGGGILLSMTKCILIRISDQPLWDSFISTIIHPTPLCLFFFIVMQFTPYMESPVQYVSAFL